MSHYSELNIDQMNKERELQCKIEDILLEFASLYNEVTTSDLQGMAAAKADEIIKEVRKGG